MGGHVWYIAYIGKLRISQANCEALKTKRKQKSAIKPASNVFKTKKDIQKTSLKVYKNQKETQSA